MKRFFDFKKNRPWARDATIVSQLGLTMVGCIMLCLWLGRKADQWLGTGGIFTALGTVLGVVGGGAVCYRQILELTEQDGKGGDDEDGPG